MCYYKLKQAHVNRELYVNYLSKEEKRLSPQSFQNHNTKQLAEYKSTYRS